jgi:hypothetical protein
VAQAGLQAGAERGLVQGMEPALDEQGLQFRRQRLQRGTGQAEARKPARVEAVGATGEQDAVAGLLPNRQGVGQGAQQLLAGVAVLAVALDRDGHLVKAVEQQEGAALVQMGLEQRTVEAVRRGTVDPVDQGLLQLDAAGAAPTGGPGGAVGEVPQQQQQRQAPAQVVGGRLGIAVRRRYGMVQRAIGDGLQQRPAAEGGLAAAGRGWGVQGLAVQPLEQQRGLGRLIVHCRTGLGLLVSLLGGVRGGQRRHIDLPQLDRLALLGILAEQLDAAVGTAQPGAVGIRDDGGFGGLVPGSVISAVSERDLDGAVLVNSV